MITQYITYMAIKIQNKDIESVFVGKKLVNRIYLGAKIVWDAIKSCFSKYWKNNIPWVNSEPWEN